MTHHRIRKFNTKDTYPEQNLDNDHAGMPFGIQILSAPGNDRLVAKVAKALEIVLADNTATKRPVPDLDKLQS